MTRNGTHRHNARRGCLWQSGNRERDISRACRWAHRTALVRRLKGLEEVVSLDIVDPVRHDDGWEFTPSKRTCTPDSVNGVEYLREVYTRADPNYTGRVTVPVLYDTETDTIVNNESADIARMLDRNFDALATRDVQLYPEHNRDEIDTIIDAMSLWNETIATRRYVVGDQLTLADVFFFPTLYRFDAVYHTHFKCSVRRLIDFEHLWDYARDIYQTPGVAETCNMDHVKAHYYRSHDDINPTGFVPVGPDLDWTVPHGREAMSGVESDRRGVER